MKYFVALLCSCLPLLVSATDATRAEFLRELLHQDCGSCHGLSLRGGLGPPLRAENLHDKPLEFLAATILVGRPGTPMPPWDFMLSEADALWLAAYLKEIQP
jgi:cytochrome c55X